MPQIWHRNLSKFAFFEFSKKRKMVYFKLKNLCDESLKIKNLRWQISWILCCLYRGLLLFFRYCFHREICRSKSPVLEIFKKTQKRAFLYSKIGPLEMIFLLVFPPIFLACPRGTLWAPKLWSGTLFSLRYDRNEIALFQNFRQKYQFFHWSKYDRSDRSKLRKNEGSYKKKLIKSTLKYMDRGAFSTC